MKTPTLFKKIEAIASADTPIEDILEFKQRRKDELIKFQVALGNLYQEVITSTDIRRSTILKIDEIALALNDLHRVMGESFVKKLYHRSKSN